MWETSLRTIADQIWKSMVRSIILFAKDHLYVTYEPAKPSPFHLKLLHVQWEGAALKPCCWYSGYLFWEEYHLQPCVAVSVVWLNAFCLGRFLLSQLDSICPSALTSAPLLILPVCYCVFLCLFARVSLSLSLSTQLLTSRDVEIVLTKTSDSKQLGAEHISQSFF